MHHILRDRKTGVFDHAVGLGNAGEPAKRKHAQYKGRRLVSQKADPPVISRRQPALPTKVREA